MELEGLENCKKIYFIGIGGISMSALAKYLSLCGYSVYGSDAVRNEETENLPFYGIKIEIGKEENYKEVLGADVIVYTDAIPNNHKQLEVARRANKRLYSRGELLEIICKNFSNVIGVAGSHGKTTCTSMCAHVLRSCGVDFTAHIGGHDSCLGNFFSSGNDYFITEACEYKKNLLKVHSTVSILLNIDKDHMECYQNEQDLVDTFYQFCKNAKTAFVCADDEKCKQFTQFCTFGIKNPLSDYRATQLRVNNEQYSFLVEEYGKALCRVKLKSVGQCNVYNALAAFAAMRSFGFHEKEICRGLENFSAVKRRFERMGEYHSATFLCDYAHHPKEIKSTVLTASGICKGDLYVVFQPHTYSRTKNLMQEFVEVLRPIKNLLIYKTYPAREKYDEMSSAKALARIIGNCLYVENVFVLKTWIKKTVKSGDIVLFLGAGDIYHAVKYLLKDLT